MSEYRNNVANAVSGAPGTGTITLASAISGAQSFSAAYGANATVDVFITDGGAWEVARNCTYTHSGTTLGRGTLEASSTGAVLSLTSAAVVRVGATAESANTAQSVLTHADRSASYGFFVTANGTDTQAITDAGWRVLHGGSGGVLRSVEWNAGSVWSADTNGRATLPDGRWMLGGCCVLDAVTTSQRVLVGVAKNGEATPGRLLSRSGPPGGSSTVGPGGATIVESAGSDYFTLVVFVDGSGTHTASATNGFTQFWAQYLGPRL